MIQPTVNLYDTPNTASSTPSSTTQSSSGTTTTMPRTERGTTTPTTSTPKTPVTPAPLVAGQCLPQQGGNRKRLLSGLYWHGIT